MWIVRLALDRRYTFIVMAFLIIVLGTISVNRTPTDIFPVIDIPVVTVIWTYNGLSTQEVESRIALFSEFSVSAAVNDVKSIESQTLNGVTVIKIYFHPSVRIDAAIAQVTAVSAAIQRRMPVGINPPIVLRYNASSVPILQLGLSSDKLTASELYDFGIFRVRQQLAVVQGTTLPAPYGGKVRQIQVDLNSQSLQAYGLTAIDVSQAINAQNLTLPTGTAKIGEREYTVAMNSSPDAPSALNDVPIKEVNGKIIFVRDVANVHDGTAVQDNIVRQDGVRGVLLTILKNGNSSTLDIVNQIDNTVLPALRATAPPGLKIGKLFDQSVFVRAAINGVLTEGLIAGCLTAMMILLFLGSWRSTLIVAVSIPLSILSSLIMLYLLGETLNVMTLGGLALAVGILVDDATVTIENIHLNMEQGKPLRQSILDGAMQIATPTFVATLTICIVFVSVIFLTGPAKYLFTPLAMAVVFAMLASYLLSRTLVPTLVMMLLPKEAAQMALRHAAGHDHSLASTGIFGRIHNGFNRVFESLRSAYTTRLEWALNHTRMVFGIFVLAVASAVALAAFIGQDFFPFVDAGQMRLHVRAPAGTRVEETERIVAEVEAEIRKNIPEDEVSLILDNIGRVSETFNLAFGDGATIGSADAEILISLDEKHHGPTAQYMKMLRQRLQEKFPDLVFFFQPSDMTAQILNFGLPAPIDVQVVGFDRVKNYEIAKQLEARMKQLPGAVDVHLHQVIDAPQLYVDVDRTRAAEAGMTQRDVANNLLVSLSGSGQVYTNFWGDPATGITYQVAVQTPQSSINSIDALGATTLTTKDSPQQLRNFATISRRTAPVVANHTNVQPVFDIYANVQDSDLGSVAREINGVINEMKPNLPPGTNIIVRGQVESMNSAFSNLAFGLFFAAVLVYFLMVVNFQSWVDPFIIITALPGALCGIVWMLFITNTNFSVPSLMGAIMSVGVATANSILLVNFANDRRAEGLTAIEAALDAGRTRLRPILMTALAMIIGMVPMALGLGEGGEQNAPLGRSVVGGLLVATFATLFFVPVVYSILRKKEPKTNDGDDGSAEPALGPAPPSVVEA